MPKTFGSSLVLSATAYLLKPFLRLGCKDVKVNGLPILLNALKEGSVNVGGSVENGNKQSVTPRRRGIVTSRALGAHSLI